MIGGRERDNIPFMRLSLLLLPLSLLWLAPASATTISLMTVFEPISIHGTDGGESLTDSGEVFQATVIHRAMVLSGAFPETLVEAIKTPHRLPANDPNYQVDEVNLLILCRIGLAAEMTEDGLAITFHMGDARIPDEVDATLRQVTRLSILAVRKTLEIYQAPQPDPLRVVIRLAGLDESTESLRDLEQPFEISGQ